ncbi:MAG: hypothetical protein MH825_05585 [Cyanobacteria bacterium]|nr:hypothetical protein [Cyanobacteriota bacterium]
MKNHLKKKLYPLPLVALLLSACAPSKADQCAQTLAIAQGVHNSAAPAASGQEDALRAAATGFDEAVEALETLRLSEEPLTEARSQLSTLYGNTSQAIREFLTAVEQQDRNLAEVAVQSLEQLQNEETTVLSELQKACAPDPAQP